jgi:translation initiation factor IF-3
VKIRIFRDIGNFMRRRYGFKPKRRTGPIVRVNEMIRIPRVLVIDETGKNLGEMSNFEAIDLARSRELDLVEVNPKVRPPVCRILDYGKYQYQKAKEERSSRTKQKKVETKGIRIGIRTDEHDLEFKKKQAEKFLRQGNKIKVEILLRGREKAYQNLARSALSDFIKKIETPYKVEEEIKRFPGGLNIIIAPG